MNTKEGIKKAKELLMSKRFWKNAFIVPGCIFTFGSVVLTFIGEVGFVQKNKLLLFIVMVAISGLSVLYFLLCKVRMNSVTLKINHSTVDITVGDIFKQPEHYYKVIAFNEFFDTLVDGNVISENSLNGQYLLRKYPDRKSVENLNDRIALDEALSKNIMELNCERNRGGKTTRYKLGSIFKNNDYFFVAFSRFNDKNAAGLTMTEYVNCLLKFWEEVECYREGRTVVLPLLGSGITRYKNFSATNQELLEVIIWTFEMSKVNFKEPSKVKIVIHESREDSINFYKIKELEKEN